jgi:hypothetical protein
VRSQGQTRERKYGLIVNKADTLNIAIVVATIATNMSTPLEFVMLTPSLRYVSAADDSRDHHDLFGGGIEGVDALGRFTGSDTHRCRTSSALFRKDALCFTNRLLGLFVADKNGGVVPVEAVITVV